MVEKSGVEKSRVEKGWDVLQPYTFRAKKIIMSATGMTIILIVLVVMAFCVILYMFINCYRGFTLEQESKKPPNQRRIKPRNRQTSSSSEQMQKPASLLQVL